MHILSFRAHQTDEKPAFDRLLAVITFLLVFLMAARTPLDTDMWWHLSAGEEMLRSHAILRTEIFSFSRFGDDWTNPYWLSQIVMAVTYHVFGWAGISAGVALLAVCSMMFVYWQCEGPELLKTTSVILSSVVASVVWSPRPQLISLVWLALTGYLVYLYKWRGKKVLWGIPLVFVLWANTHGGYPLGLILIGCVFGGEILNHLMAEQGASVLSWRKIAWLGLCGLACSFAVLLNPNGVKIWLLPFQTVDMQVLQAFIPEWASPDFHNLLQQTLLWLLMACVAVIALSGKRIDGCDLLLLLVFAYLALLARRNFGPFALIAAPILCRYGAVVWNYWRARSDWLNNWLARKDDQVARQTLANRVLNLMIVAVLGLAVMLKWYGVSHPVVVDGYLAQAYPVQAVRWLKENLPGQRLMNEYNWGGYLQWALREIPVFVDGRTDIFNDEIIGEWFTTIQAGAGWQTILDRYQVDLIMLQPDRPVLAELEDAGWRRLYEDDQAVVYGR